ncbi:hypothetical protein GCM10025857_28930 [Alicyclobacillus contaminans]|uniref:class I SAM-dependent methyltransferase n=1 Tax=Alicyclobacillus contaminans TaxID=392016 RepID=UPI00040ABA32|nr:class I SAM-dependent methyltransferase [Alicyclobacillus contaminans]GMA51536.1 hypothetical protein GCM10025857_28930 [Alicyclobacillus contaminans]
MYGAKDAVDFFDMLGQVEWQLDLQRTLIHWVGLRDSDVVLDAGCGAGRFLLQLAQRVRWVTGLDADEPMLQRARLNAEDHELDNADFVLGDVLNLPFSDDHFDKAICVNLLFLLRRPELALSEFIRVVKPGGEVILLNPSVSLNPWTGQQYCDEARLRDFDRESLLAFATAAARHGGVDEAGLSRQVAALRAEVTESLRLMHGLVLVSRIIKRG